MRVTVLGHTAATGGAELALLRLVSCLAERVEISVVLFSSGPLVGRLRELGVNVVVVPLASDLTTLARTSVTPLSAARSVLAAGKFLPRLIKELCRNRPDLIVANTLKAAVFAALAAPISGRPWVWHLHDRLASDYLPRYLVSMLQCVAVMGPRLIIANSEATLSTLSKLARRKAVVAYPGLPAEAFGISSDRGGGAMVGVIGRISPTKGQREFLTAAAIIASDYPSLGFRVVGAALFGESAYEEEIRRLSRSLGIDDRVEFTGWVADPSAEMRTLRVFVHASPVAEPFGQVVVEAMAAGVPVIATNAGGVPEIFDPDGSGGRPGEERWRRTPVGILVKPGDASALAGALRWMLDNPVEREQAAKRAEDEARRRFRIERTAAVVDSAWREATTPRMARMPWGRRRPARSG